ncbi:MAG TPA: DUF1329 domain-containing protein [Candidatus Binataceae bacterium]
MKRSCLLVTLVLLITSIGVVRGDGTVSPASAPAGDAKIPAAGTVIDSANVDGFAAVIPGALQFAIRHGLSITVVPTQRIDWPAGYQHDTEKYSGQVTLDDNDTIHNFVSGLPFPMIDSADPKAAVKVAYNWRWGPFIPAEATLVATEKTSAYSLSSANPANLIADNSHRDYRNENNCDQLAFVHYAHALGNNSENTGHDADVDWKERGDRCGPENGAVIGIQHLDPARDDDMWVLCPWRQEVAADEDARRLSSSVVQLQLRAILLGVWAAEDRGLPVSIAGKAARTRMPERAGTGRRH